MVARGAKLCDKVSERGRQLDIWRWAAQLGTLWTMAVDVQDVKDARVSAVTRSYGQRKEFTSETVGEPFSGRLLQQDRRVTEALQRNKRDGGSRVRRDLLVSGYMKLVAAYKPVDFN